MEGKTAFIFPAFITEFTGKEIEFLKTNGINIDQYLTRISNVTSIEFPEFTYDDNLFRKELYSQLLAYSLSCAFYDVLEQKAIKPDFIAGYSMGIYASLYAAKSIEFEVGAKLIIEAYNLVYELTKNRLYGMGAIIGLSYFDIEKLIKVNSLGIEIINVNNEHSMVVAGFKKEISILLEKCKEEGALTVAELTVEAPYHSKHLSRFFKPFMNIAKEIEVNIPKVSVVSTYDQRIILSIDEVKQELVFNLTKKINWHKTMQKLIDLGVKEMFECGAGKDLKKISRFIYGDYKLKSIYKV